MSQRVAISNEVISFIPPTVVLEGEELKQHVSEEDELGCVLCSSKGSDMLSTRPKLQPGCDEIKQEVTEDGNTYTGRHCTQETQNTN